MSAKTSGWGRAPRKGLIIDHKKMRQDSIDLFQRLHLDVDPDEKMGNLTVAKMQMVEIAKAVSYDSKIVIMDEPTSSLTETEVEHLFRIIEMPEFSASNVVLKRISLPSKTILPDVGGWMPIRHFIKVDLPAPFSPIRVCTVPGRTLSCTPFSARTPGKSLTISVISRIYS